jgi:hypothetical protein
MTDGVTSPNKIGCLPNFLWTFWVHLLRTNILFSSKTLSIYWGDMCILFIMIVSIQQSVLFERIPTSIPCQSNRDDMRDWRSYIPVPLYLGRRDNINGGGVKQYSCDVHSIDTAPSSMCLLPQSYRGSKLGRFAKKKPMVRGKWSRRSVELFETAIMNWTKGRKRRLLISELSLKLLCWFDWFHIQFGWSENLPPENQISTWRPVPQAVLVYGNSRLAYMLSMSEDWCKARTSRLQQKIGMTHGPERFGDR